MRVRYIVLGLVAVLALGIGITTSAASKKHSHGIPVTYVEKDFALPSAASADYGVGGGIVFCPYGYNATGGGFNGSGGLPYMAQAGLGLLPGNAYEVIAVNQVNEPGTMTIQVACVRETTDKARGRVQSRETMRAEFEAKLRGIKRSLR